MKDIITKFAANTKGGTNSIGEPVESPGGSDDLWGSIQLIINAVIGVLGLVCVVIIIVGGVNYMTSSGDAGKVKNAKDTILYGIIGLVICVLAFAIVNFVLSNILGGS